MKTAVNTSDTLGLMLRDLDQFPMPDHEQQVELARGSRPETMLAEADGGGQPPPRGALGPPVPGPRRRHGRPGPGGHVRPNARRRQVRLERGFRFSTYATWSIRQALQRAVQQHGRTIRIPLEVGEQIQRLELTKSELASTLGRAPPWPSSTRRRA